MTRYVPCVARNEEGAMLKRIVRLVPLVALIFVGGGGCGGCGPTSPGRTCGEWVTDNLVGSNCFRGDSGIMVCTPRTASTCVRWDCS